MPKLDRGLLFVIEGIDGAGKTTQARLLAERLRADGFDCVRLREPTDGPFGRRIRELAVSGRDDIPPEEELELFVQDRKQNVAENIRPALEAGRIVILDRYYFSTIAYQGARGCDPAAIQREHEAFACLPNVLFYLTIPLELVKQRIEQGRGESRNLFENLDYLREVKAIFDALDFSYLRRVDGARGENAVAADIHAAARAAIDSQSS